jgi:uncharacterized membrane protein YkvA (DUF1232 family)
MGRLLMGRLLMGMACSSGHPTAHSPSTGPARSTSRANGPTAGLFDGQHHDDHGQGRKDDRLRPVPSTEVDRRSAMSACRRADRVPVTTRRSEVIAVLQTIVVIAGTLVVAWCAFVVFVWVVRPDAISLRDAARLLPDTLRLVRRLGADRTIPRRTRWLIWGLLLYLASPIDLIPDFLPVVGYADDAIVTSFVLRRVIKKAGPRKLADHWPGTSDGLAALMRILRLNA